MWGLRYARIQPWSTSTRESIRLVRNLYITGRGLWLARAANHHMPGFSTTSTAADVSAKASLTAATYPVTPTTPPTTATTASARALQHTHGCTTGFPSRVTARRSTTHDELLPRLMPPARRAGCAVMLRRSGRPAPVCTWTRLMGLLSVTVLMTTPSTCIVRLYEYSVTGAPSKCNTCTKPCVWTMSPHHAPLTTLLCTRHAPQESNNCFDYR